MYQPQHDSLRSKRRAKRGFISLAASSRKHRRAMRRQDSANIVDSGAYSMKPGETYEPKFGRKLKIFYYNGSGKMDYH